MRSDAQHNRAHLLAAAHELVRHGRAPTLNELARHAGMGVATVYRHFPDADALAAALMEGPLADLEQLFARASRESDPFAALKTLFLGALELQLANPVVAQLVHAPDTTSEPIKRLLARMQREAHALVKRARRAGVIRASIDGDDLCRLLQGIYTAAIASDKPKSAAHRYADILLTGLTDPR